MNLQQSRCETCERQMEARKTTAERPYHYTISGLDNVFLVGIDVEECPECRIQEPIIPRMDELHQVISQLLLKKDGLLTGKEIRFLRKNAGIAANRFAALIEQSAEHVSRVENGKLENLGATADKLARAVISAVANRQDVRELLLNGKKTEIVNSIFGLKEDHWERLAA